MGLIKYFKGLYEKAAIRGVTYTSMDAMKLFAIFNMTADHIGLYLAPHDLWWRAIGRITFPVWFFLVGYTRSKSLGSVLWIYAVILILDRPFNGLTIFPLNALISIIVCRYWLNACSRYELLPNKIPEIIIACFFLALFAGMLFEYGSIAILYATFGRMAYEKQQKHFKLLVGSCYVLFVGFQFISFEFDIYQNIYVVLGTAWVVWWLATFKNTVIWTDWTTTKFKRFIAVLSRNTLEYYFVHRLILEITHKSMIGKWWPVVLKWF